MSKMTVNVKVSFAGKFVMEKEEVIEVVEDACECLLDKDSSDVAKNLAGQVLLAGLEDGLDGVAKFLLRNGIRKHIKDSPDLDEITHKSPALVTFR